MAKTATSQQIHDLWVKRWRHCRDYYRPWNDLYGLLLGFSLDLLHYKRNRPFAENDPRRIQPQTQRLFDLIRHKTSDLATSRIQFQTRPLNNSSAYAAHLSDRVLRGVLFDPAFRYPTLRTKRVISALSGGRGCTAQEYDPDVPGGVCLRIVDPRRLFVTPGVIDFHDPRAMFTIEEVPMHVSQVRAMENYGWKVPENLQPDNFWSDYMKGGSRDDTAPVFDGSRNEGLPGVDESLPTDGIVIVLKIHSRKDPFAQTDVRRFDLPQADWHWKDQGGNKMPYQGNPLAPPMGTDMQNMSLVTTRDGTDEHYLYPQGCLYIIYPNQPTQEPGLVDDWLPGRVNQDVRLAHFPYTHMIGYHHPLRLIGSSDTQLLKSLTHIDNTSLRSAWEQMRMAQALLIAQKGKLLNADDSPFEFSDAPMALAYASDRVASDSTKFMHIGGMNPAVVAFRQELREEWARIGTGDLAMPEQRSRDVAVGTLKAFQDMGDLPLKLHQQDMAAEEAVEFRNILDLKRAYTAIPELVSWINDDEQATDQQGQPIPLGMPMSENFTGDMLAPIHVVIDTMADSRAMDADIVQAVSQFCGQLKEIPSQMWGDLAEQAGFGSKVVQKFKQLAQSQQSQQPPPVPADKLITALAAAVKSGMPLAENQAEAAFQMGGLPPPQSQRVMPPEAAGPQGNGRPPLSVIQGGQG